VLTGEREHDRIEYMKLAAYERGFALAHPDRAEGALQRAAKFQAAAEELSQ
jgi:hypothetical protein